MVATSKGIDLNKPNLEQTEASDILEVFISAQLSLCDD